MSNGKLESAGQILPHLFNSHKIRNKAVFPKELQQYYWQCFLEERWLDICGNNLSKLCGVKKLEGNILTIETTSSTMSNELYMMKKQLLKKVNFLLQGMWAVKDINFYISGSIKERKNLPVPENRNYLAYEGVSYCSRCGAKLSFKGNICCCCERKEKELLKERIKELLRVQPWLDYTNCLNYLECDKILFTTIKENLKNYYFEQVRLDYASENEKLIAVMLLTGKDAIELDEATYNNAIAFLRRKKNVSTRRI